MLITGKTDEPADFGELLARARAGDAHAFCELAAPHEGRLLQQAFGLCRDQSTAEDVASETLVEAWRSLARYNGSCRFSTWLYAILLHRYQKTIRAARSRPISLAWLPFVDAEKHLEVHDEAPAIEVSPPAAAAREEAAGLLR